MGKHPKNTTKIISFRIVSCYHIVLVVFLGGGDFDASEAAFLKILLTCTPSSSLLRLMEEFYIGFK